MDDSSVNHDKVFLHFLKKLAKNEEKSFHGLQTSTYGSVSEESEFGPKEHQAARDVYSRYIVDWYGNIKFGKSKIPQNQMYIKLFNTFKQLKLVLSSQCIGILNLFEVLRLVSTPSENQKSNTL